MVIITKNGDLKKAESKLKDFECPYCGCNFKTNEVKVFKYLREAQLKHFVSCPYCKGEFAYTYWRNRNDGDWTLTHSVNTIEDTI